MILQEFDDKFISTFEALIFDCDGTLVESLNVHHEAWEKVFSEYKIKLPLSFLEPYNSISSYKIAQDIIDIEGLSCSNIELADRKESLLFENIHLSREIFPISAIAKKYYNVVPMAVISGGVSRNVLKSLEVNKLSHLFDVIVSADDTCYTKDGPEVWLEVANNLGVRAEGCLVFEDGEKGMQGAIKAGMKVVDVRPAIKKFSK